MTVHRNCQCKFVQPFEPRHLSDTLPRSVVTQDLRFYDPRFPSPRKARVLANSFSSSKTKLHVKRRVDLIVPCRNASCQRWPLERQINQQPAKKRIDSEPMDGGSRVWRDLALQSLAGNVASVCFLRVKHVLGFVCSQMTAACESARFTVPCRNGVSVFVRQSSLFRVRHGHCGWQ